MNREDFLSHNQENFLHDYPTRQDRCKVEEQVYQVYHSELINHCTLEKISREPCIVGIPLIF